jgi:TorA-specific chaperone
MSTVSISGGGAAGRRDASTDETLVGLPTMTDEELRETMIAAFDLLAHFWSRPVAEEVERWETARDIELAMARHLATGSGGDAGGEDREPVWRPVDVAEMMALLDEHERLFVGPGRVPCPPYESFWREDVPVDIRRSLVGPCATDLRRLYLDLGLELSERSGDLPDHVAVELEALAYALSLEGTERVARRLYSEHLGSWLPRLCQAVVQESGHGFYRDLAELTVAWLAVCADYFASIDAD